MEYVRKEDADIFCIQETKCDESNLPKVSLLCRSSHGAWIEHSHYILKKVDNIFAGSKFSRLLLLLG